MKKNRYYDEVFGAWIYKTVTYDQSDVLNYQRKVDEQRALIKKYLTHDGK